MVLGWMPIPDVEVFGVFVRDEIDDDRTPSSAFENVSTDRLVGRVGFEDRDGFDLFDRVRGEARVASPPLETSTTQTPAIGLAADRMIAAGGTSRGPWRLT